MKQSDNMKRILVIVVTYNGMKWVDRCMQSVVGHLLPVDVMVVDNGSTDGTVDHIREYYPSVILHCTGENYGFGRANNIGFSYALEHEYQYVYLLNQDAWVMPDTFMRLVEAFEKHPEYGVLSPVQMTASMDNPDPRFAVKCLTLPLEEYPSGMVVDVPFVMAAHWMINRACFTKVGGFSPAFAHYGEDDNYVHRAKYHGFKVGILSAAGAVHDREMRPSLKESRMRLKCVASVVKLSNPLNSFWFRCLFQPVELLAISIRYRSASVFRYIFKFIGSYGRFKAIRAQSKSVGAFL